MRDVAWLCATCRQIVASREVVQFVVGITTNPTARRAAYKRWAEKHPLQGQLDGFVILDWALTVSQAKAAEKVLFESLYADPKYGVIKRHYHPAAKDVGPQSLYIAWWSPHLVLADG